MFQIYLSPLFNFIISITFHVGTHFNYVTPLMIFQFTISNNKKS